MSENNSQSIIDWVEHINNVLNDISTLIGDTPVSLQIEQAIHNKADCDHTHNYVSIIEFNKLKAEVERLTALIGDTPVAEQINSALQR